MPEFDVTIQGKTYHVEIPEPHIQPLKVVVDGEVFEVTVEEDEVTSRPAWSPEPPHPAPIPPTLPAPSRAAAPQPGRPAASSGSGDVVAPMPGTILTIQVTPGQPVNAGDVLCILEAMKMKNPIRASRAGTVTEIAVETGQTVAYGDLLIRIA